MTKKCPHCGYVGGMIDTDGYILECPECNDTYNEDDYEFDRVNG